MEAAGSTTLARRYHLCPAVLDAQAFARAMRAYRGVENRLHRVLDVVFHDDLARLPTGHGFQNMAAVKHMAMNLLNKTAKTDSLKTRRRRAGWDDHYRQAVVTQTAGAASSDSRGLPPDGLLRVGGRATLRARLHLRSDRRPCSPAGRPSISSPARLPPN